MIATTTAREGSPSPAKPHTHATSAARGAAHAGAPPEETAPDGGTRASASHAGETCGPPAHAHATPVPGVAIADVFTLFQPLVSVRRRAVVGMEALSRGRVPGGAVMSPDLMFSTAAASGSALELDRLCRERAFAAFAPQVRRRPELLLFVNIDTAVLRRGVVGSGHIQRLAEATGISPNNVVLEIVESQVDDTDALMEFAARHRRLGFLVALDDVGAGHSNLERIAALKPDVLKLDRSLVSGLPDSFHRQEVVRALVGLARRIGAMTVAEGVEHEREAALLMDLGADVMQGFLFAHPSPEGAVAEGGTAMHNVARAYAALTLAQVEEEERRVATLRNAVHRLREDLHHACPGDFDKLLARYLNAESELECLYVLDGAGRQISDTVCNPYRLSASRRFIYQPARRGTDHSLKEYFLPMRSGIEECLTAPYISRASGNLCVTLAVRFTDAMGAPHVLCADAGRPDRRRRGA